MKHMKNLKKPKHLKAIKFVTVAFVIMVKNFGKSRRGQEDLLAK